MAFAGPRKSYIEEVIVLKHVAVVGQLCHCGVLDKRGEYIFHSSELPRFIQNFLRIHNCAAATTFFDSHDLCPILLIFEL